MPLFEVQVEKRRYQIGSVRVRAKSEDAADALVAAQIATGQLQSTTPDWYTDEYEDDSFCTTGEVYEVEED